MADEDYDADLLAIAGIGRQAAGKKRNRKAAAESSDELSAEEGGQAEQGQFGRSGRKGISSTKKRRVVTSRVAGQVRFFST